MKMTPEPKHKIYGTGLSEWIEKIPNELERDAVGVWQILPTFTEAFGLEGPNLAESFTRAVTGLMDRGAVPVDGVSWRELTIYGTEPADVAANILKEWEGRPDTPGLDGVWFDVPEGVVTAQSGRLEAHREE